MLKNKTGMPASDIPVL